MNCIYSKVCGIITYLKKEIEHQKAEAERLALKIEEQDEQYTNQGMQLCAMTALAERYKRERDELICVYESYINYDYHHEWEYEIDKIIKKIQEADNEVI